MKPPRPEVIDLDRFGNVTITLTGQSITAMWTMTPTRAMAFATAIQGLAEAGVLIRCSLEPVEKVQHAG